MSHCYVVRNQNGHYASKQREWVDGRDTRLLYRTPHHDEALNLVFELSSKDIYLRAEALRCELDERQQPAVEPGPEILRNEPEEAQIEADAGETPAENAAD